MNNISQVDEFYNSISKSYTESIQRCVPRYREMLESLFAYLKPDFEPKSILELGCGTGNLTHFLTAKYPNAKITAVDISTECINECKIRLPEENIEYINSDFRDLELPENSFDLIVSSISIHHIDDSAKGILFRKIYSSQTKNGILSFCDQFRGETEHIYKKHIEFWKMIALEQGSSLDEWNMWMKHQEEHDFHSSLSKHLKWLEEARYKNIDCTRRFLLWTTIYAEK